MEKIILNIKNKKLKLFFFVLVLFYFSSFNRYISAYALDVQSDPVQSIFNQNPFKFSPIDLNKFVQTDRSGLTFTELANTKSFSTKDIGASIKAVLILFIKLMVTTLNVALGILKALLGVLNQTI